MSANLTNQTTQQSPVLELKAGSFTLPLLRLFGTDMDAVAAELSTTLGNAPQVILNTPIVIDLEALSSKDASVEFPLLVGLLRGYGMIPVGVYGGTKAQNIAAQTMELPILSDAITNKSHAKQSTAKKTTQATSTTTKIITHQVRSGQRVYAPGGNLVILSNVSSGGEVMADGDIHVYGALRGRAFAGIKKNTGARIFCQSLHAELVSVAGRYRLCENLATEFIGKQVQIYLKHKALKIEPFSN